MEPLTKVVTARVKVSQTIADLVYFVKYIRETHAEMYLKMSDEELIAAAESFWDTRHGED
jgi:hypothetical protein